MNNMICYIYYAAYYLYPKTVVVFKLTYRIFRHDFCTVQFHCELPAL